MMSKEEIKNAVKSNPYLALESKFRKSFPEEYSEIIKIQFPDDFVFKQKLYHWLNNDLELKHGICPACGNRCVFTNTIKGYKTYCSKKCSANSEEVKEKRKQILLEKYGVDNISKLDSIKEKKKETCFKNNGYYNPMQSAEVKEAIKKKCFEENGVEYYSQTDKAKQKSKETCLKKYGVEHFYQSEEFKQKSKETCIERYGVEFGSQTEQHKEKYKETCLERYGVEYPTQSSEIKEKTRKSNLEKYGVEHPFQLKENYEKVKQTNLEKYGVVCALHAEEIKEKVKKTNIEKYGVECSLQSTIVREKCKETMKKRYGVEYPLQLEEFYEKAKQTNLERYGVEYSTQSAQIKEKVVQTNMERYGVKHPAMLDETKERTKQSNMEKYGVEYPMKLESVKEKAKQTSLKRYGCEKPSQTDEIKEKIKRTNFEKYGVEWFCIHPNAKVHNGNNSKPNMKFAEILEKNEIEYNREFPLNSFAYDFKVDNILVEINPTITHNSHLGIFGGSPKKPDYHLAKTKTANDNGYRCIHVWDWDDQNKIINILNKKHSHILYARNLTLKEVGIKEANEFLSAYHLQSTCKGQIFIIGLYNDNVLVQLMSFGKPRYNKNYEWELLRLCTHKDYKIVGGAERLFNHFKKTKHPNGVISYCDISKFNGNVYEKMRFVKTDTTKPTKHWWNGKRHITDNFLRQRGFDQLFGTNYGKGTSNEELMLKHGFLPVYDCGQDVWVWKI